jgi:hypothetical protein
MVELLHIGFHVEYVLGYEEDPSIQTGSFFKGVQGLKSHGTGGMKVLKDGIDDVKAAADDLPSDDGSDPTTHDDATQNPQSVPGGGGSGDLMQQGFMAMQSAPAPAEKGK